MRDDAACACDCAFTQGDSGQQRAHGASPCSTLQLHRPNNQAERGIAPVMIARADIATLRDADIVVKPNSCQVIDPGALTNPAMLSNLEMPGILDGDLRMDHDAVADLCAKQAQKCCSKTRERQQRAAKQRQADEHPSSPNQQRSSWRIPAVVIS